MNVRYQHLKTKEYQALLSPEGRQIFAQRKIDVEPVFGQIKACLGYKRCNLRGKRQVKIDMGLVLMANNLLKYNKRVTRIITTRLTGGLIKGYKPIIPASA